jgi:hypothetical protein
MGWESPVRFTTLISTTSNDGDPFDEDLLERVIEQLWQPFRGMSEEGWVKGRWRRDSGRVQHDLSRKITIECERERLQEVIRAVKKVDDALAKT